MNHLVPSLLLALATLAGCAGTVVEPPAPADKVPAICHAGTASDFHFGRVTCEPLVSETCGFGIHNQPVPLDQSGAPLAYYCACNSGGVYACWGSPGLAVAEPLPPEPGQFGAACGIGADGSDAGACALGLECFGVCTFECGQKYYQPQADGPHQYGLDRASVDRCAERGGACSGYAPGVDINICKTK